MNSIPHPTLERLREEAKARQKLGEDAHVARLLSDKLRRRLTGNSAKRLGFTYNADEAAVVERALSIMANRYEGLR